MLHERFDIEKFTAMFPLNDLRRKAREFVLDLQRRHPSQYANAEALEQHVRLMEPSGEIITGPMEIAVVEQLRAEAFGGPRDDDLEKSPTDVFVWASGDPADRLCTKIGGLPFWPRSENWPVDEHDRPLEFVAQLNFSDSRFLFDNLPGDLLLIFAGQDYQGAQSLQCRWVRSRSSVPIDPTDVPKSNHPLLPVYGVLHRTYDYPQSQTAFSRYKRSYLLSRIEGTKIGGFPRWIQGEEELPGGFLCALGSVNPRSESPYPFVNVEKPLSFEKAHNKAFLKWGDVGSIYFFLDEDGQVRCVEQCY